MKTRGARHKAVAHRGGALECNMKDGVGVLVGGRA